MERTIRWWPQPRQFDVLQACGLTHPFTGADDPDPPVAEVLGVGGSAGGGKTDSLLAIAFIAALTWAGCNVAFFRRTFPELSGLGGAIQRSQELLTGVARWTGDNHRWTFPNGSCLQFCHCQREKDVHNYQSLQFDLVLIDEATHFTQYQVQYLRTRNRATVDGVIPFMVLATNPGGVGHLWFKTWFIDAGEFEQIHDVEVEPNQVQRHYFVPARLADNQILEKRDPGYRRRLENLPEALRRALLHGDWDVFEGQVFTEWRRDLHVIKPFTLPADAMRWVAVDWGYAVPFCALWLARCKLDLEGYSPEFWRWIVYREAYQPGLTDPEQAEKIAKMSNDEKIRAYLADPSMWTKRTVGKRSISSADVYRDGGIRLRRAENDRLTGKRRIHEGLSLLEDGKPRLLIFENCRNLIRTLPALPYDEIKVEDVDTDAEDHAYDTLRYAMSFRAGSKGRVDRPATEYWGTVRGSKAHSETQRLIEYPWDKERDDGEDKDW